jgi:Na+-transporting NADH:ubiquinone oxidoreductase subunit C
MSDNEREAMAESSIRENPLQALSMLLGVAVLCALLVSVSAVKLQPRYVANLEAYRLAQLESILSALSGTAHAVAADKIESRVVELASGRYADGIDAVTFDARKAAVDPNSSTPIPPASDVAGIKRRAKHAGVFLLRDADGHIQLIILPVRGSGYQSSLYGFLALSGDTSTVVALRFYEQGDTPGMGGRIQDPSWEALWPGKQVYDESGTVRIGVARGKVSPASVDAQHMVDGISGATRTSQGVHGLLRFWLDDFGFGPFLERVRRGEA